MSIDLIKQGSWTCEFCSSQNFHNNSTCEYCNKSIIKKSLGSASMPLFLMLIFIITGLQSIIIPIIAIKELLIDYSTAIIVINGEPLKASEHWFKAAGTFLIWWCIVILFAYGIFKARDWVRIFFFGFYFVGNLSVLFLDKPLSEKLFAFIVGCFIVYVIFWYFYKKENVVEYFESS